MSVQYDLSMTGCSYDPTVPDRRPRWPLLLLWFTMGAVAATLATSATVARHASDDPAYAQLSGARPVHVPEPRPDPATTRYSDAHRAHGPAARYWQRSQFPDLQRLAAAGERGIVADPVVQPLW